MSNLGGPEFVVILVVALLVLGPQRLPQMARQAGKALAEFRRVTGGLQTEARDAMSSFTQAIEGAGDESAPRPAPAAPYVFSPPPAEPPSAFPSDAA